MLAGPHVPLALPRVDGGVVLSDTLDLEAMQMLARAVLLRAEHHEWTLQGLGMLRLYLGDGRLRLHVWDATHAEPNASRIHDHPWDFESIILAGRLTNVRYVQVDGEAGELFKRVQIRCGEGGCAVSPETFDRLVAQPPETYGPGDRYHQNAAELHDTQAEPGTVTIIRRRFYDNRDLASVWWRTGAWGSAEPRPARRREVVDIVEKGLLAMQLAVYVGRARPA